MAAPSNEELRLLCKLRHHLHDLKLQGFINTDLGLLQWLRARDLNLEKTVEMIRKSMKWRADNDLNSILTWEPPKAFEYLCPVEFCGYDRENSPICFIPFGSWDARQLINLGHRENFMKYANQIIEKLRDRAKTKFTTSGLPVTQCTLISDMSDLSLQTLACIGAINMFLDALQNIEENYPETIRKLVIVNASRVFTALFVLVRPLLSARTFGKIEIYNNKVDSWMPVLLHEIAQDQIPQQLLKNRKFMTEFEPATSGSNGLMSVYLEPGTKLPVDFNVKIPMGVLSWSFRTEEYGIGFSLMHDNLELIPFSQVKSHKELQEGVIICQKAGLYTFVFDNSNSLVRGKVLKYRIELTQAEN